MKIAVTGNYGFTRCADLHGNTVYARYPNL